MDRAADTLFDTAPPDQPVATFKRRVVSKISSAILPVVKRAARPYLGGDTIEDALCVSEWLIQSGVATTIGYWDGGQESLAQVERVYLAAIAAIPAPHSYLSIKPPALRFSCDTARALAEAAAMRNLRLHCDSHGVEVAGLSNAMLDAMRGALPPERLGATLPGRWQRSLRDADWAAQGGLNVRVVKGQWPDPDDCGRDPARGFLEVVSRLAGQSRHVAVATHDLALARECIGRLKAAGTPCEIEVLLGYPAKPLLQWAEGNAVSVRVYVPYGSGFIPNAIGVLRRNPRLILKVVEAQIDRLRTVFFPRG